LKTRNQEVDWLRDRLNSRNGFVRKGARAALAIPKRIAAWRASDEDFAARPTVLANSFPKSGTHLLAQVAEGLPDRVHYGTFLGSETSSFQLRVRTPENTCRFIRGFVPGEIVRGHLYYEPLYAEELARRRVVNYFIYRDPRAVVVSEAHYLREMNRWHRLHPYFRRLSIDDAILLSITGLTPPVPGIWYPNIAERFARYEGWLHHTNCLAIRYEELVSERQADVLRRMAEFYRARASVEFDLDECVRRMVEKIAPEKSHTFRSGKKAGWRHEFHDEHRRRFVEIAGDLLLRLGYEANHDWAVAPVAYLNTAD